MIYDSVAPSPVGSQSRQKPFVQGKFLSLGTRSLWVKGVTYGTFRPNGREGDYDRHTVTSDFRRIKENHINAIRIYTMPPQWMLDLAEAHGIRVLIGFPWEEHVTFLDQLATARTIRERLKTAVRQVAHHPAVLACAIGNEIPSPIVRWHGAEKIQNYLRTLYETAKDCDPDLLVTYVNYPSTEYLHLPFLDFYSFNVFLESRTSFQRYLSRLHNLAGEKPLFLTEVGLDSRRNGLEKQARLLRSQIWSAFRNGCAGLFVYSWTDEWFRGGQEIEDWDFGLTTRDRHPKPALEAVRKQFSKVPFRITNRWPKISVVVCSYNGSKTIEQCLQAAMNLEYDDYEVIVVDDGSTDSTAEIASRYPVRLIRTPNRGLSAARNRGLLEATGEIIAYIDDDAYPDPHWLHYLAVGFQETSYDCIGGPNLPPRTDGIISKSVAQSPGGPVHVLLSDDEAEHVPGCNMAFRKEALEKIGGFDPQFRVAGDDVDVCWRLLQTGRKIGYQAGAFVWHHRRQTVRTYYKQQRGYGKAEVLLARKWPEKYNGVGHVTWAGRIYNNGSFSKTRIYAGIWGTAPFQSLYERSYGMFTSVSSMPEWILFILLSGFLTSLGFFQPSFFVAGIFLVVAILVPAINAFRSAHRVSNGLVTSGWSRFQMLATCTFLHLLQPLARFIGRWPLWRPAHKGFRFPVTQRISVWNEEWQDSNQKLSSVLEQATASGSIVSHGGPFDGWDLEAKGGAFGSARLLMTVEEHGQGKQMTRYKISPHTHWLWPLVASLLFFLAVVSALTSAWVPAAALTLIALAVTLTVIVECGGAISGLAEAVRQYGLVAGAAGYQRPRREIEETWSEKSSTEGSFEILS